MRHLKTATALSIMSLSAPAFADLTPRQVWDEYSGTLGDYGYSVDATITDDAGTLVASDITMTFPMPEEDGSVAMTLDALTFTADGAGGVVMGLPDTMPISISVDADGEEVDLTIDFVHDDLDIVVTGDPGALSYAYTAKSMGMNLSSLVVDGEILSRDVVRFDLNAGPVDVDYVTERDGDIRKIAQSGSFGDLTFAMAFNDPDSDDAGVFSGTLAGLNVTGSNTVPDALDMTDPAAFIEAGLIGSGELRHSGGMTEFSVSDGGDVTSGQINSASGYLLVDFAGDALRYAVGGTEVAWALSGSELPFPISFGLEETRFDIVLPLGETGVQQEAKLGMTFGGLTLPEMLWNMFDPSAALPRDPATLAFDITALVTPFVSIFDEEAMMNLGDDVPGELNAVTLDGLNLTAGGGRITGNGAFTFDNSDLESFDGLPRPEGKVDLEVSGANGLIDSLIDMGLVDAGDAMGVRMMLSMFTVPGEAPDTATSTLEINEQGQILANGQRIR